MSFENTASDSRRQRRVGRVEKWLRKGYGFIVDMGRLETDAATGSYGWVRDDSSGRKVFVYHNALKSDTENVFHRLFANEYVEFTIDLDRPQRDNRLQAFDVTGLQGGELLYDLNASAAAAAEEGEDGGGSAPRVSAPRSRRSHTTTGGQQAPSFVPPAGATVVYYVPAPGGAVPQPTAVPVQGFPPVAASSSAEPSYVMPASGIPVPK